MPTKKEIAICIQKCRENGLKATFQRLLIYNEWVHFEWPSLAGTGFAPRKKIPTQPFTVNGLQSVRYLLFSRAGGKNHLFKLHKQLLPNQYKSTSSAYLQELSQNRGYLFETAGYSPHTPSSNQRKQTQRGESEFGRHP